MEKTDKERKRPEQLLSYTFTQGPCEPPGYSSAFQKSKQYTGYWLIQNHQTKPHLKEKDDESSEPPTEHGCREKSLHSQKQKCFVKQKTLVVNISFVSDSFILFYHFHLYLHSNSTILSVHLLQ